MELIDELTKVHNEGFGSKYCCLVCPIARTPKAVRSFYQRHPERLPYCGVALGKNGEVLGFIQIAIHPMHDKDGLHETKPGEAYIEQVGVGAAARGKGVGKLLLTWAETQARERGCTLLTLGVLNGNPARRLYERFGFREIEVDPCEQCIVTGVVFCIVGRPYGLCDPHCGAVDMRKPLQ
eukprot:5206283-Prymnesium_polylepis.2